MFTCAKHVQVLKHCLTRRLSLLCIMERVLTQGPAFVVYFTSLDGVEKPWKETCKGAAQRPSNKTHPALPQLRPLYYE